MSGLRQVLRINALSCFVFGLVFMFLPVTISRFFGNGPEFLIIFVGIGLFVNGLHLWAVAKREEVSKTTLYYFSAGNALWAFLAVFMMVTGVFVTTTHGYIATTIIACWVGAMAFLQFKYAKQAA